MEDVAPGIHDAAAKFLAERTAGESEQKLVDLFPGAHYDASETVKADKFPCPYEGKQYNDKATEIVSMGMKGVFHGTKNFWQGRDYAKFMPGLLATE